jgi:SAM-dependent methyltransferase
MKNTERFSDRAEAYRRHRPSYPVAVAALIRDTCGFGPGAPIADIGAGTGLLTRILLEAGFDVTAVEPNEQMLEAAIDELRHFPLFRPVAGAAEATGLAECSFDAITVAQAFHWFDREAARVEFERILRPGGWVFVIRNHRLADANPFARDLENLLNRLVERYGELPHRNREARERAIEDFFPAGAVRFAQFDNPNTLNWEGLRGRVLSVSYTPTAGQPGHHELFSALEEIFETHARDGRVTFPQVTEVHYGRLSG